MKKETALQTHISTLQSLAWRQGGPDKGPGAIKTRPDLGRTAAALLRLQRGLTGSRELAGGNYMDDQALLAAYLLYYWPVSYQQVSAIVRQIPAAFIPASLFPDGRNVSILDVGSGPGPASAAICDFLLYGRQEKPASLSVCLADHSPRALSLARTLFARDFPSVQTCACTTDLERGKPLQDMTDVLQGTQAGKKFSAAIFCHSLNELWQDADGRIEKRTAVIEQVLDDYMEENALLILCEPAQTQSSRELIAVRDALLSRRSGLDLIAPCVSAGVPCPALLQGAGSSCHAEEGWEPVEPSRSLAEAAGLDRQSIKMAYFVFRKGARRPPSQETDLTGGCFTARIVSDAMLNKGGRIRFVLCDGTKRFSLSAKKGDAIAEKKGFWKLRRGKTLRVRGAERRGEDGRPSFAVTEATEITILS